MKKLPKNKLPAVIWILFLLALGALFLPETELKIILTSLGWFLAVILTVLSAIKLME